MDRGCGASSWGTRGPAAPQSQGRHPITPCMVSVTAPSLLQGKAVYFVSNNSSKSREEYLHKLHQQGIQAQEVHTSQTSFPLPHSLHFSLLPFSFPGQHEMFCTAYIVAYYLKHVLQFTGKVYLMGMPGFAHELELVGVAYTGTGVGQGLWAWPTLGHGWIREHDEP